MKSRSSFRQVGVPRGLPPLIVLLALGSALFHGIAAFAFLFAVAMGEPNLGDDPSPHEPPYSETAFFVLLGLLVLGAIVMLACVVAAFGSLKTTFILSAIGTGLDVLFLVGEALAGTSDDAMLSTALQDPAALMYLLIWIGPPAFIAGSTGWVLRRADSTAPEVPEEGAIAPAQAADEATATRTGTPKPLIGAMLIGLVYALTPLPFGGSWAHLALIVLAVGIPTFPHQAHWIVASFLAIAAMHFIVILVEGPADSFPGVVFSLTLTLIMLRLVVRGQRNLGMRTHGAHSYTSPGLGHG